MHLSHSHTPKHTHLQAPATAKEQPDALGEAWNEIAAGQDPMLRAFEGLPSDPEALARALESGDDAALESMWQNMLRSAGAETMGGDFDEAQYAAMMQQMGMGMNADGEFSGGAMSGARVEEEMTYELSKDNPYSGRSGAFDEGMRLYNAGQLNDAVLAFHAAVEADPANADAWHMLGVVHQENDEDKKAIYCLEHALEQDAYHLDALLALGVSYVNELKQDQALKCLKTWVAHHPALQGLKYEQDEYSDGTLQGEVMQMMTAAERFAPRDPGVQEVLGVLYNVSRDYDAAVAAFRRAVAATTNVPSQARLTNKIAATMANGYRSEEAIPNYQRALELRPTYPRAMLNLGISYSNIGDYQGAATAYIKALIMNPNAVHVYGYLRLCFSSMGRFDLIPLTEKRDLDALRKVFEL